MTLADHAEARQREHWRAVPTRGTPEWNAMYEAWVEFAFPEGLAKRIIDAGTKPSIPYSRTKAG